MIVVDASVWISSLLEQDLNREASVEWLLTLPNRVHPIYVPGIALPEVGGAMARRGGSNSNGYRAVEVLLRFPGIKVLEMSPALSLRAANLAIQCRIRGAESIYVALAEDLGVPLVTWDREQLIRSLPFVKARNPG